jgi:hypothetical protein
MKIELKFDKNQFTDMIKKMAVPRNNANKGYHYPIIYPKFIPVYKNNKYINSMLEWIVQSEMTTWVRVEYERCPKLTAPIRIPIDVENTLKALKNFTDKDEVFFIHDSDEEIQTITDNITFINMPIIGEEQGSNVYDAYPGHIEPETEIIIFRDNTMKPDIAGSCDVKFLQKLFTTIKNVCLKDDNIVYNFIVDGDSHQIIAYTNKENIKTENVVTKVFNISVLNVSIFSDSSFTFFSDIISLQKTCFQFSNKIHPFPAVLNNPVQLFNKEVLTPWLFLHIILKPNLPEILGEFHKAEYKISLLFTDWNSAAVNIKNIFHRIQVPMPIFKVSYYNTGQVMNM